MSPLTERRTTPVLCHLNVHVHVHVRVRSLLPKMDKLRLLVSETAQFKTETSQSHPLSRTGVIGISMEAECWCIYSVHAESECRSRRTDQVTDDMEIRGRESLFLATSIDLLRLGRRLNCIQEKIFDSNGGYEHQYLLKTTTCTCMTSLVDEFVLITEDHGLINYLKLHGSLTTCNRLLMFCIVRTNNDVSHQQADKSLQ